MENQKNVNHSKHRVTIILVVIATILSIPLIAMFFTNEVNWTLIDFISAGILLLSASLAIELVIRYAKTPTLRTVLLVIILLTLFLVWTELAVGIFGTPLSGS
ncbi:hypothetical protein [Pedobacter nototheniae]|uniref:hypothetical protein n=1 Tax=Pedobacter nototheniae TaxID=2488994 RepID=UPI00292DBB1B|nr:hypothetical protein [Pedobacter nototheniae]